MLKSGVKKNSSHETGQSSHFPLVPSNNPKTQLSTNDVPNDVLSFYSTFETVTITATQESQQQDTVDKEIESETQFFFAEENLL